MRLEPDALKVAVGVFILGGLGSVLRFTVAKTFEEQWPEHGKWIALHAVNLIGALAIGAVEARVTDPSARQLLMAGILGGLTTFSALCLALSDEIRAGRYAHLALHAGGQIVVGVLVVVVTRAVLAPAS